MESKPPKERGARRSLRLKIEMIEGWLAAGEVPQGAPGLMTLDDVRKWKDQTQGLTAWSSKTVMAPSGPNADLRIRLGEVLKLLAQVRGGAKGDMVRNPGRGRTISERQLRAELERTVQQVAELMVRDRATKDELERQEARVASLVAENKELLAKLSKISPLRSA